MSPRQLLKKLEELGIIEEKILKKIRKEIENPEKKVKPKAVLSYLVKKGQINEKQAAKLLKSKPKADEIAEVKVEKKDFDTSDLMGIAPEVKPQAAMDPGATMEQMPADVGKPEESTALIVMPTLTEEPEIEAVELDAHEDPMGGLGGFDDGFTSGGYETQSGEQETKSTLSFAGKKDSSDQWQTKWVYIGSGILGFILILTAVLWLANLGQKPEDMYKAALDSYNNQSFGDATKKLEEYLEQFPNDKNAKTARALRVNSILRSTYGMKNWSEVIQQADTLLVELSEEEDNKMDEIREDLGVMLPRCLVEITAKAKKATELETMEKELGTITDYKAVIDNPVYIPGSIRKKPSIADNLSRIDNNIRTIKGQIDKEKLYKTSLVEIEKLRQAGETDAAFETYQKLTRNYGDLAGRVELRDLMLTISAKERELVKSITPEISVDSKLRPSLIKNSVVLAAKSGEPIDALKGEIVPILADGAVYGIDAGEGSIAWRHFVGFQTTIQPTMLNDEFSVVANQRDHELMVLDRASGAVKWRAEIGEPFLQPTIGERSMIVTTESGKILSVNSETGAVEMATKLPQKQANCPAMIGDRDPYTYQPGFYSNIYVLSNLDLSCKEVFYLGHYEGSITVPPKAWFGYILVAVNGGDYCDLHVLKPRQKGVDLELVQSFSRITSGTVSTPFQRFGRLMLMASDNGEMRILEVNQSDESNPVRIFANDLFQPKGGQQSFFLAEGSNLWVAGSGAIRYRIRRNEGKFDREVITEGRDTFVSQIHKLDDYLLHVRRRNRSGMLTASVADAKSLDPIWQTHFAGKIAGAPQKFGDKIVAVSDQGDLFQFDEQIEKFGYTDAAVKASTVVEDLRFESVVPFGNDTFACLGPAERKDLIFAKGSTGESKLMTLAPPADKLACEPMPLGPHLIVPCSSGQIAKVDPRNGRMVGSPFQPPIQPGTKTSWFEPTLIKGSIFAVAMGATEGDDNSAMYLLDASNKRSVKELAALSSADSFKSRLVNDGQSIFGVIGPDQGNDRLIAVNASAPLAVKKTVVLPGKLVEGPWIQESGLLVKMDDDKLYCFSSDLTEKWSIPVPNVKLAAAPKTMGAQLMVIFQNGKFKMINPTTGQEVNSFDVGQPIIHEPLIVERNMYLSGLDGTVHVVDLGRLSQ